MRVDGRDVLLFAGSNYLDLAHHPEVVEAAARAAREPRLRGRRLAPHQRQPRTPRRPSRQELAKFLGTEAALVFNTGYMANVGVIPALVACAATSWSRTRSTTPRSSTAAGSLRAEVRVFAHGELDALEATAARGRLGGRRVLLVVDGVYSMDGDVAPLGEMVHPREASGGRARCCSTTPTARARWASRAGRGSAELLRRRADDIDVVTRGPWARRWALSEPSSPGGGILRELLVNVARSFIFSCALAPPQVEASRAALRILVREPWRRERLQANAARLRRRLAERGIDTHPSVTHILPVIVGDNATTMSVCEGLLARGFYAQGIRHPTVPEGTARLRLTPMATHTDEGIDALAHAVAEELARHGCAP